jgi:hypothetical protein
MSNNTTNFFTSKRRVIRISPKGAPYTQDVSGKKAYSPIAKFVKTANGSMRDLAPNNVLPSKVKRSAARKGTGARFNAARVMAKFMNKPARKTRSNAMGRGARFDATRVMAKLMNKPARKTRSNAGVRRKPVPNFEARLNNILQGKFERKVRKNKGVKRGPRGNAMPTLGSLFN